MAMMTLIAPGSLAPDIVISDRATASERYAAEEMAAYLEKISGARLRIVDDTTAPSGTFIGIGRNKLTATLDIGELDAEQYAIEVRPNGVFVVGGRRAMRPGQSARDAGTLYGVYEFLEGLGVRWYRPESWGEHVPKMAEIRLRTGRTISPPPPYVLRSMFGGGMCYTREESEEQLERTAIWAARNRINTICPTGNAARDAALLAKLGGTETYSASYGPSIGSPGWDHVFSYIVPEAEFWPAHPEYFALVNGARKQPTPRSHELCLGNPELQKVFADKLVALAGAKPYATSLHAEPSDAGGGACECPLCKALDEPKNPDVYGQTSNRIHAFESIVAGLVAEKAPWVKVQWFGYSTHTSPPSNIKRLSPNTIVMLCPINELDDWRKKLFDPSSPANARFVKESQAWAPLRPSALMVYDYYDGYGWPGPTPVTRTVADRMRSYRALNITGVYNTPIVSWGPQGMDAYMTARLLWNPDLDVEEELDLYYENYYGPAAAPMKAYHERLMAALERAEYPVQSGGRGMYLLFTPALVKELGRHIAAARSLAVGQALYELRLRGVCAGYEAARRVCGILSLRKARGVAVDTPGWNGKGSCYQCPEAQAAYLDMVRWMRSVNAEEPVFDMLVHPKAAESEMPSLEDSCFFAYMGRDILANALHPNMREEVLLEEFYCLLYK